MNNENIETIFDTIKKLRESGNLEESNQRLLEAVKEYGDYGELYQPHIDHLLEMDEYQEVIDITDIALELMEDPKDKAMLAASRGYAFYRLDDLENARIEHNIAVRYYPNDYDAVLGRAMVHEDFSMLYASKLDLERAIDLCPTEGQPYAILASIYLRLGDAEKCKDALKNAVERDPTDFDSMLELARIFAIEDEKENSMQLLTQILDAAGDDEDADPEVIAPAALLRSQESLAYNSVDAATEDAKRALEIIPDLPWAYLQLAAIKIHEQVDGQGAVKLLKQAQDLVDDILDLPDLFTLYAAAYQILGKDHLVKKYQQDAEGVAQLPQYVYGPFNPVENIPINPQRPIDFRRLVISLFGSIDNVPADYEQELRKAFAKILSEIPEIQRQNPGVQRINIQLPYAQGMIGGQRTVTLEIHSPN